MPQTQIQVEREGLAFRFKLPKEGLALRSVHLEDSVAELRFDASPRVPTLTEEDVAVVFRLVLECKRPEFYYAAFPDDHPFFGRQYKYYNPEWLRGTSVGVLLSEVDWAMKCLHIGARSDETKSRYRAWSNSSQLTGLRTKLEFPKDGPLRYVIMSCAKATVQTNHCSLTFPTEPNMEIVDKEHSLYSKYITEMYSKIAYYDEPLFLKMQELVKLILSVEWLKTKGILICQKWLDEYSQPLASCVSSESMKVDLVVSYQKIMEEEIIPEWLLPQKDHWEVVSPVLGPVTIDLRMEKFICKSGIELKYTKVVQPCHPISTPKIEQVTTVKLSLTNYDWLYADMDPRQALHVVTGDIIPNVHSWNELYLESVPRPVVWKYPCIEDTGPKLLMSGGGISTKNIPTTEVADCEEYAEYSC